MFVGQQCKLHLNIKYSLSVGTCEWWQVSVRVKILLLGQSRHLRVARQPQRGWLGHTGVESGGAAHLLRRSCRAGGRLYGLLHFQLLNDLLGLQRLVWRVRARRSWREENTHESLSATENQRSHEYAHFFIQSWLSSLFSPLILNFFFTFFTFS